jgi:hypothetical protein
MHELSLNFRTAGSFRRISLLDEAVEAVSFSSRVFMFLSSEDELFDVEECCLKALQCLGRKASGVVWWKSGCITEGMNPLGILTAGLLRSLLQLKTRLVIPSLATPRTGVFILGVTILLVESLIKSSFGRSGAHRRWHRRRLNYETGPIQRWR